MARVLEAAETQFCEHGYDGASIDAIAAASGVSKVTIYSYFPTKADLFQSAINQRVESQFAEVDWARLDPRKPREALTLIGRAFLALMRSEDVIKKHRTLYGTQGLDSTAAESYVAAGPMKLVSAIAMYLDAANKVHSLQVTDTELSANQFLSLFLGLGQIRALLGLSLPTKREDEELLRANVELFLRGLEAKKK